MDSLWMDTVGHSEALRILIHLIGSPIAFASVLSGA